MGDEYSSVVCVPNYSQGLASEMFQEAPCAGADRCELRCSHEARWLLLQKFPQYATNFLFFTDEKLFSVASPDNRQNDRIYAPRDTRKRSIAAERLPRCRPTFSKSLILSKKIAMTSYA